MALVTRARAVGILSLCLLLLSSLGASGALAGAAPRQIAAPQAPAVIVIGTNSCVGTDACLNAVGPIGDNSCNGEYACKDTTGSIGDNSCNGGDGACELSGYDIGNNSCNGSTQPCQGAGFGAGATVGNGSCNGAAACQGASGNVGNSSCNGLEDCRGSTGPIGDKSCIGDHACDGAAGSVGDYSCNGEDTCASASASIGDCANNAPGLTPAECAQPDARIRRIGKHNMVGNDIYNTDGTNQTLTDTLGDRRVRFVITIQNDGDAASSFTIGSSNGVTLNILPPVNFYHGWNPAEDITAAVMAGTYTTPTIQPGGVYRIRAVVRPLQINFNHLTAGPGIGHYSWLVTATNTVGNPAKADAVRFEVDVPFT